MVPSALVEQVQSKVAPVLVSTAMAGCVMLASLFDKLPEQSVVAAVVGGLGIVMGKYINKKPEWMRAESEARNTEAEAIKAREKAAFDQMVAAQDRENAAHDRENSYHDREIKKLTAELGAAKMRADISERLALVERIAKHDALGQASAYFGHIQLLEQLASSAAIEFSPLTTVTSFQELMKTHDEESSRLMKERSAVTAAAVEATAAAMA